MFADGIRVEGLRVLAKNRIAEGSRACVQYARDQNPWASEIRTPELMADPLQLRSATRRSCCPNCGARRLLREGRAGLPGELMQQKAKCVREAIATIEAATTGPELVPLPKQ
jgi:hypothetical protein